MGDVLVLSPMQHRTTASSGQIDDHSNSISISGHHDPLRSPSSSASSPEQDLDHDIELHDHDADNDGDLHNDHDSKPADLPPPPQKRKGGRKPIYATSEERKQRNRQAQAAFRERRTEYIKQLESTIKTHEEALASLQASHRNAADECLMLRYKNSLLERILIEKGIDVQAELRAKTGSPNVGPTKYPVGPNTTPTATPNMQRFPIGKYGARRPLSMSAKSDGAPEPVVVQTRSPLSQATSASHLPSPIAPMARSPNFLPQGGPISPSFGPTGHPNQPMRPQQPVRAQFTQPPRSGFPQNSIASAPTSAPGGATPRDHAYFISPFQNHYDQLDEEYDAQANMVDEQEQGESQPFTTNTFTTPALPQQLQHGIPPQSPVNPNTSSAIQSQSDGLPHSFDPADPMLDADPFGLSASMYFPTPYSFEAQR